MTRDFYYEPRCGSSGTDHAITEHGQVVRLTDRDRLRFPQFDPRVTLHSPQHSSVWNEEGDSVDCRSAGGVRGIKSRKKWTSEPAGDRAAKEEEVICS